MKSKLFIFVIALIIVPRLLTSEILTPEKLLSLKRISDVNISQDGKKLLYTVTFPDFENNTYTKQVFMQPVSGGEAIQLTRTGDHNYNPVWSPKADKVAFISDRDGKPQVYIMDMDGGEPRKITNMENGVSFLSWSPDGKHLAFCSDVKLEQTIHETHKDLPDVNAYIYDDLPIRHWDHYIDEKYRHLFVIPAEGGEPRDLMEMEKFDTPLVPFGGHEQIAWSPNGTEIAYTCKKVSDFETSTNSDIYVVPVYGGKAKNITQGMPGFDKYPVYPPNGNYIAFHSQKRAGYESDRVRLMLHTRSSSRIGELSKDVDQHVGTMAWTPRSDALYFSAGNNDGTTQLWHITRSGTAKVVTKGSYYHAARALEVTPDGNTVILSREDYMHPTELYAMNTSTGTMKQITHLNDDAYKNIDIGKVEARWITSTDSANVHCWVVYPPNFDPSKKYPMITYCQGGPQMPVTPYFSYGWNFLTMASEGYIVLAPNRRGCMGFGQKWIDSIRMDYGGQPMDDIMAATKALAKEPYVDETRLAAIGGSAGGYAAFFLEGNDDGLYSTFVSHCGMFNMESKFGSTEEMWFPLWDNGGPYWERQHKRFYDENSPHRFVKNWDTPILIITGEKDYRVPYTQSLEAFTAAQMNNVPSRIIVYPDEIHWITHPQEKILWYREFFRFLELYCKNKS